MIFSNFWVGTPRVNKFFVSKLEHCQNEHVHCFFRSHSKYPWSKYIYSITSILGEIYEISTNVLERRAIVSELQVAEIGQFSRF